MARRPDLYNDQLAFAEQLEQDGKAVIIRPTVPLKIGRLDQKPQQLLKAARSRYRMRISKISRNHAALS